MYGESLLKFGQEHGVFIRNGALQAVARKGGDLVLTARKAESKASRHPCPKENGLSVLPQRAC